MWALFALPIVRKIAAAALVLAAICAIAFSIYHAGEHAGARGEAVKETEANRAQFEQAVTTLQAALTAGQQREAQLADLAVKFADVAAQASSRVENARQASAADAGKVHALPDSAVKADLETKAGGPLENPAVLRHVDELVTDYPHQLDIVKAQADGLAALNSSLATSQSQTRNAEGERDSAIAAFNGLVPLYAQAYNAAIEGHRKWYCLFLCKPKRTLKLPAPATLAIPAKPTKQP
jgi:hypothetical protein